MSATQWGGLLADPAFRDIDAGPSATTAPEYPEYAGTWPEEIEIEFLADTARTIPGMGEKPDSCGVWFPREFCSECGEPHFGESACQNRSCPDCYPIWMRDRVESETIRLAAARHVEEGVGRRAVHAVVSPPAGAVTTVDDLAEARTTAYRLAETHGIRGGLTIEHGFRVKQEVQEIFAQLVDADLTEAGLWQWVRQHHKDWRELTCWSPHFHIVGLCRDFAPNSPEQDDGWVVERLSTLDPFRLTDPAGYDAMVRCLWYQLSHATFGPDGRSHAITWFGDLAYNKFSPEQAVSAGVLRTIERYTEEALEWSDEADDESDGDGDGEDATCERDGCDGELRPIWEAGRALQDAAWCDDIGREQQRRLTVAWEWAIGDIMPPPGMKKPRTRTECDETFRYLFNDRYG